MQRARLQRAYPVGTSELIITRDRCESDYRFKAVSEFGFTNEQADAKVEQARVKPHAAKMLNAIYDAHRKIEVRSNTIDCVATFMLNILSVVWISCSSSLHM